MIKALLKNKVGYALQALSLPNIHAHKESKSGIVLCTEHPVTKLQNELSNSDESWHLIAVRHLLLWVLYFRNVRFHQLLR